MYHLAFINAFYVRNGEKILFFYQLIKKFIHLYILFIIKKISLKIKRKLFYLNIFIIKYRNYSKTILCSF